MFPWILSAVLLFVIVILSFKIYTIWKSMDEICLSFREHLAEDKIGRASCRERV